MKEWMKKLRMEDLQDPYHTIAERFGMEIALEMASLFQGSQVYFPRLEYVTTERRKALILEEFDGYNYKELAKKYACTERWVRKICEEKAEQHRNKPLEGQLTFHENSDKVEEKNA